MKQKNVITIVSPCLSETTLINEILMQTIFLKEYTTIYKSKQEFIIDNNTKFTQKKIDELQNHDIPGHIDLCLLRPFLLFQRAVRPTFPALLSSWKQENPL